MSYDSQKLQPLQLIVLIGWWLIRNFTGLQVGKQSRYRTARFNVESGHLATKRVVCWYLINASAVMFCEIMACLSCNTTGLHSPAHNRSWCVRLAIKSITGSNCQINGRSSEYILCYMKSTAYCNWSYFTAGCQGDQMP